MRVYVTRSKQLTLTIKVNGVKENIVFDRGIRDEKLMAIMLRDQAKIEALETLTEFNREFWFYEEHPDVQPKVVSRSEKKIYYKEEPVVKADLKAPETPKTETTEPVKPAEDTKPKADKTPENKPATDYPEVTNGQKAKLLLLTLVPGSVHADFTPATKAREAAKKLNITFSNWPVQ